MRATKVYLAGAIDGQPEEKVKSWRSQAADCLTKNGFEVIDPTAGKDLSATYDPNDIVETDLANVERADIILCEMNTPGHAYIGTAIELRKAWEYGKPIICWGTANRCSYFLQYHALFLMDTLDEALNAIIKRGEL